MERARAGLAGLVVDGGGADVREAALDGGGRQRRARGVERRDAGGRPAGLAVAAVAVAARVRRAARAALAAARAGAPAAAVAGGANALMAARTASSLAGGSAWT